MASGPSPQLNPTRSHTEEYRQRAGRPHPPGVGARGVAELRGGYTWYFAVFQTCLCEARQRRTDSTKLIHCTPDGDVANFGVVCVLPPDLHMVACFDGALVVCPASLAPLAFSQGFAHSDNSTPGWQLRRGAVAAYLPFACELSQQGGAFEGGSTVHGAMPAKRTP